MIELKGNPNYGAIVVNETTPHQFLTMEGFDRVQTLQICGLNIITKKDLDLSLGAVVFPTETRLSEKYLSENNLYRDKNLNRDKTVSGYFDVSGRVKAIKFGKGVWDSNGLLMPLSSFEWISGFDIKNLTVGTVFDTINDNPICEKYVVANNKQNSGGVSPIKRQLTEKIPLPEHISTAHWGRVSVDRNRFWYVSQKLHGTSARYGCLEVSRRLGFIERILKRLGVKVRETEWKTAYGSRRVIKNYTTNKAGYYANDVWSFYFEKIQSGLEKGQVVYGEIIGWDDQKPIQIGYTYGLPVGEKRFYVYRITTVNEGVERDWSVSQILEWCNRTGFPMVPTLAILRTNEIESWLDKYRDRNLSECYGDFLQSPVPLKSDIPDEGVVLRSDLGNQPQLLKAKWPAFLRHESALLDSGVSDTESEN